MIGRLFSDATLVMQLIKLTQHLHCQLRDMESKRSQEVPTFEYAYFKNGDAHITFWSYKILEDGVSRIYECIELYASKHIDHNMINSVWPSDAIWLHRSESTLAQVMACCPTAPSHYLNQCWLIINENLWHSPKSNSTASAQVHLKYMISKLLPHLPGANELTHTRLDGQ